MAVRGAQLTYGARRVSRGRFSNIIYFSDLRKTGETLGRRVLKPSVNGGDKMCQMAAQGFRTLTPLILVRIQVPSHTPPWYDRVFSVSAVSGIVLILPRVSTPATHRRRHHRRHLAPEFSNIAERSIRDLSPLRRSRFHTVWMMCASAASTRAGRVPINRPLLG
jgi:hypothetical protein